MTSIPAFKSLIAPNIFDAYANPNLLLYLVASNLLSPATWELSEKIKRGGPWLAAALSAQAVDVTEIQKVIDQSFQHLHAGQVVQLYGEIDVAEERRGWVIHVSTPPCDTSF